MMFREYDGVTGVVVKLKGRNDLALLDTNVEPLG